MKTQEQQENYYYETQTYTKTKKNKNNGFKSFCTSMIITGFILLGLYWVADASGLLGKSSNPMNFLLPRRQNILLLGLDANGNKDSDDPFEGNRSDTIILVNLDPFTRTVNAISIPRDSKVFLADHSGTDKINAAHAIGGPKLTIKTIESTLGVKIDHYVEINFEGIKKFVDALGGVYVNVEKPLHYNDYSAHLFINLKPGLQLLDSDKAEQYLRFRHDAMSDLNRMQRQQWFMKAIVKRLQSPDVLTKIPQLVEVASKYTRTDMSFNEMLAYTSYAKGLKFDEIQTTVLPGKPSNHGYISYWILDAEKVQDLVDTLIYRQDFTDGTIPKNVSIYYAKGHKDEAMAIKDKLASYGYNIKNVSRKNIPYSQIVSHSKYFNIITAAKFKSNFPQLEKAQFVIDYTENLNGDSDFSLLIANDPAGGN